MGDLGACVRRRFALRGPPAACAAFAIVNGVLAGIRAAFAVVYAGLTVVCAGLTVVYTAFTVVCAALAVVYAVLPIDGLVRILCQATC
jgi:hypothetical protein